MYACQTPFHYWFLVPLVWLGVILVVALVFRSRRGRTGGWCGRSDISARAVAERRYAAGEISQNELASIMQALKKLDQ